MTRLTCLIPAWNEAARLPGVLAAVQDHPLVDRLLVIDDGSTDGTPGVARRLGAEVLEMPVNGGKTAALAAGIAALTGEHALLLDADLLGLTAEDVTRLAAPVLEGQAEATISLRGNAPWTPSLDDLDLKIVNRLNKINDLDIYSRWMSFQIFHFGGYSFHGK